MRKKTITAATKLFETRGINASGIDLIVSEGGVEKQHFTNIFQVKAYYLRDKSDRFYVWLENNLSN